MKTKPITLPIDPAKAHLYVARNGVKAILIVPYVIKSQFGILFEDGYYSVVYLGSPNLVYGPYNLESEIIPEPEAQGRDWSEVVDKLIMLANRNLLMNTYKMQSWIDTDAFQPQALAILQEFDTQNIQTTTVCIADEKDSNKPEETAPTEEPIEGFVVGEEYEDRKSQLYIFIGYNPIPIHQTHMAALFVNENGGVVYRTRCGQDGDCSDRGYDIIKKHIPAPKTHEIDVWLNVYDNRDYYAFVHQSKQEANDESDKDRVACLRFKRTFTEGEGLQ